VSGPPATFLEPEPSVPYAAARVVVMPIPYERTVSYGHGTANGPAAIIGASQQVEFHDDWLGFEPRRAGIWTDRPLDVSGPPAAVLARIAERAGEHLDHGAWLLALGGEHSITPALVRAAAARHRDLAVIQLDAHADLRESYEGDRDSHASAMARVLEHVTTLRAIGIRSFGPEEAARLRAGDLEYRMVPGRELGSEGWIARALEGLDGRPVYLTIDVDYFDPAVIPATGTPEPGGGAWWPTLDLLAQTFERTHVVAGDLVELAPVAGLHHAEFTVARLAHTLIGLATRGTPR
jgi:agmatinase